MAQMYDDEYRLGDCCWSKDIQIQHAVPIEAGKGWNTIFRGTEKECEVIGNALVSIGKKVEGLKKMHTPRKQRTMNEEISPTKLKMLYCKWVRENSNLPEFMKKEIQSIIHSHFSSLGKSISIIELTWRRTKD